MEISIERIVTPITAGNVSTSDVRNTYRVREGDGEFIITCHWHIHGGSLSIAGKEGTLYTDDETDTVHRQVLRIGRDCGLNIEIDEVVEGLSPRSIRGVIILDRQKEKERLTLPDEPVEETGSGPVSLMDGKATDAD